MTEPTTNVVLVTGMHRSGTSLICRLLGLQGFELGNNLLEGIENINDDGFWEDQEVVSINERLFELFSVSWFDIRDFLEKGLQQEALAREYEALLNLAEDWFREQHYGAARVAIKDPRFSRLLPFWLEVFNRLGINPKVLVALRHPSEVVASIVRRDGFDRHYCYLLWLQYMFDLLEKVPSSRIVVADYDQLVEDPAASISFFISQFGLHEDVGEQEFSEAVSRIVDVRKKHNTKEVAPPGLAPMLAEQLHGLLQQYAKGSIDSASFQSTYDNLIEQYAALKQLMDSDLGFALSATQQHFVSCNQKLSEMGEAYQLSLDTIAEKDRLLSTLGAKAERLEQAELALEDREIKISENIAYIAMCEKRIAEQDLLLSELGQKAERLEQAELAIADREKKLVENLLYIEKCEAHIGELDEALLQREKDIARNSDYIETCTRRIAELENLVLIKESDIARNSDYIESCARRIAELESLLEARNRDVEENTNYIAACSSRIAELDSQIAQQLLYIEAISDLLVSPQQEEALPEMLDEALRNRLDAQRNMVDEYRRQVQSLKDLRSLWIVRLAEKMMVGGKS